MNTEELIKNELRNIEALLLDKNRAYGDSAVNPLRVFGKGDAETLIRARIDDKLSRIANGSTGEDNELDLIGYLILLRCSRKASTTQPVRPVESFEGPGWPV